MDYTIKELPESERPREKLEKHGVSALDNVELVSLVLRAGTAGKNVKELSGEILDRFSLAELADLSIEELKQFNGVSRVKAGQLKAVSELGRRMERKELETVESFSDVKSVCGDMVYLSEEELRILLLDSGNGLLRQEVFDGGVDSVNVSVREVFRSAVKNDATALILVHNHPSGEAGATDRDLEFTREAVSAGNRLGVEVLDHVVVGDEFFSMKKNGLLEPEKCSS